MMITIENVSKYFIGIKALDSVSLNIEEGEVHALVGENGAGKSTLMNIISGILKPDSGNIFIENKKVEKYHPKVALDLGIFMIHQEVTLIPSLSVAENLFIEQFPIMGKYPILNSKKLASEAYLVLGKVGLESIDPITMVDNLSFGQKQMLQLAKAIIRDPKIIIMDEPTSSLSESETKKLFRIIRSFKNKNKSIIFISHRIEEIFEICDRVTVLRDGKKIDTLEIKKTNIEEIMLKMIDRYIYRDMMFSKRKNKRKTIFEVRKLTKKRMFKDISFNLKEGEILGVYGLVGSGRTELAVSIYGSYKIDSGEIYLNNKKFIASLPKEAIEKGLGYLSEERIECSIFPLMDVMMNITISNLKKYSNFGLIAHNKEIEISKYFIDKLKIKTPSFRQKVSYLSGGNQQKVTLARLLTLDPKVLILDEPTKGIDVGAKSELRLLIRELVENGMSIIYISSELPEVIGISDRIMVMRDGIISGMFPGAGKTSQEKILKAAFPIE